MPEGEFGYVLADPIAMTSTPHESPSLAAGIPPIKTVGAPGGMIGVGIPIVAVLTIISVTRAAGNIVSVFNLFVPFHPEQPRQQTL